MFTEIIIVLFGIFIILNLIKFNHNVIQQIHKDLKNFLKVNSLESSLALKKTLLTAKSLEYKNKIHNENKYIMSIVIVSVIGEVIFYYFLDTPYFIILSVFIFLNIFSQTSLKANLIKSLQRVQHEITKLN